MLNSGSRLSGRSGAVPLEIRFYRIGRRESVIPKAQLREWAFHNLILGAKEQVIAQYGKDSTQVQELGLKRKSDYKTRRPKAKAAK